MLSMKARRQFKITHDPFIDDIGAAQDVYLNEDFRFAKEYVFQTARTGGMMALIGESGSGKSTLRRLAVDSMAKESAKIRVIVPRIIDKSRLTAAAICDAIIQDVSTESPKRSMEAKARQIERILTHSSRSGYAHVLLIEEAHDLSVATLKYLKRFWELEDGFKKILGIVLIGQPELRLRLDESRNWEAREVIRRMEVVELEPLQGTKDVSAYLSLKFARLGYARASVISEDGCAALAARLRRETKGSKSYSVAYPLLVNNWARRAINLAAELGSSVVDADVVNAL